MIFHSAPNTNHSSLIMRFTLVNCSGVRSHATHTLFQFQMTYSHLNIEL
ncbi:hypothetical protein HMPREF1598_01048 [Escherichia coli 907710]|nr:hypothetical protein HMPREF1598_01048 [Escherichia coli 907710]CAQ98374.1 hypothetical protein ECIAI1_1517 [Escherichia coli IAI1]